MGKFRIRFCIWSPLADLKYTKDNKTYFSGVAAEMYQAVKASTDFEYDVNVQPNNTFGKQDANGTWNGMLGSLMINETDIAGPFSINEERSIDVEFSFPLGYAKLGILSGMVPTNKHPFLIFAIFDLPVWIALFLTMLLVSGTASIIFTALSPKERRKFEIFSKYIWTFQASLLGQNFGKNNRWFMKHVWSSPSFQFLQSVWFISACFVVIHTYQGAIKSAFAADKLKPKIDSVDKLLEDTSIAISSLIDGYPSEFFKHLNGTRYEPIWSRMKNNLKPVPLYDSVPAWMDLIEDGKMVYIRETIYLKYLIGQRFLKTGKCDLRITEIDLGSTNFAVAFRKTLRTSKIYKKFNRVVRRFIEGNLAHLHFTNSYLFHDICTSISPKVNKPLTMSDLAGTFVVLLTGIVLSLFIFFAELFANRIYQKRD